MTTTNCKPLDWMISKATEYDKSDEHIVYRFRGRVPFRMLSEARDWMRKQDARHCDGRSRASYNLTLDNRVDEERRWYNYTNVSLGYGVYKGNETDVEVMVTIYDCQISEEDLAEMRIAACMMT